MNLVQIDCNEMTEREQAHGYLAKQFRFPEWYGANLDALYDCLTEIGEETEIEVLHVEALNHLGNYGHLLLETIYDAELENEYLTVLEK